MRGINLKYFRFNFKAMGTPCEIQLFAKSDVYAKQVADMAIADIHRLEAKYSRYCSDSLLSAINQAAASGGEISVDAETAGLLDYAATCFEQSDGLFDISSGILRRAWRLDAGHLPEQSHIDALLEKIGWQKLLWKAPLLAFPTAGMELDFGGIVKEYAVDRAAALCRNESIRYGVINLGGDIKTIGPRPDDRAWRVGISHPRKPGEMLETLSLSHGAVASSGDYERCIVVEGIRYGHVLNPRTGWPVKHLASVSVVSDFCVVAGSASTIAMLKEDKGPAWLKAMGLPHIWVDVHGNRGGPLNITE